MKNTMAKLVSAVLFLALVVATGPTACSSSKNGNSEYGDGGEEGGCQATYSSSCGAGSGSSTTFTLGPEGGSSGGTPYQTTQCSGTKTSVSGRVYDPAGADPLYGVTVYITNQTPSTFTKGASCASCSSLYTTPVLASAVTDANGDFTMIGEQMVSGIMTPAVPVGTGLTLIVQVGKWRTVKTINVTACQDNPQPDGSLKLPANSSEGTLPDIAISTGGADSLECLPLRMGVSASEYVAGPGTSGHIHIYTGFNGAVPAGGTSYSSPITLWDKDSDMNQYDVVLLSCEGAETAGLTDAGRQVLYDYAENGGRVFASHFHYSFFTPTGPFAAETPPLATWTTGAQLDNDPISGKINTTTTNGNAFPEGVALNTWLGNVNALSSGELPIHYARDNAQVTATNKNSQLWISADKNSMYPGYAQYFSFDTEGSDNVCGRVVYSDLHVSGGPNNASDPNTDYPGFTTGGIVPSGCSTHPLTPQEKALEFMIFDLSSCLVAIGQQVMPPQPM